MPRRSSSINHWRRPQPDALSDSEGHLIDVGRSPVDLSSSPSQDHTEAAQEEFDQGSYELLRRATKVVERMIGHQRTVRTRKGSRLVFQVMNLMRTGQTLELEKLRARGGNHAVVSSNRWERSGGF